MADATATIFRVDVEAFLDIDCLSADELVTAARFVDPADGRSFAASRAALRSVLAPALDVPAGQIAFVRADRGRLALADDMPTGLAFNVSRTRGLALVGLTSAPAIGVDIEVVRPVPELAALARRVLRPEACSAIAGAPEREREGCFFREWVRHEARLKCRGTGIVEPPEDDGRVDDLTIVDLWLGPRLAAAVAVVARDVDYELVDLHGRCDGARVA